MLRHLFRGILLSSPNILISKNISGERLAMKMREDLFASILRQDIAFYDSHKSGEIMSRLTSDIQEFKSSFKQVELISETFIILQTTRYIICHNK